MLHILSRHKDHYNFKDKNVEMDEIMKEKNQILDLG
jgi:hypothetical protein